MKLNRIGRVVMMEHRINCWLEARMAERIRPGCGLTWHGVARFYSMVGNLPLINAYPDSPWPKAPAYDAIAVLEPLFIKPDGTRDWDKTITISFPTGQTTA